MHPFTLPLATASKDVDVLFHEALNMEMVKTMEAVAKSNGAKGLTKILFDIQDYHTSPVDAAKIAKQAGAKDLVLYHIFPCSCEALRMNLMVKSQYLRTALLSASPLTVTQSFMNMAYKHARTHE